MTWHAIFTGLQLAAFNQRPPHTPTSAPTRAGMAELGSLPIAAVLGTHQANLDERARLLGNVETDLIRRAENELALFQVEQRLFLYAALGREAARLIGAGEITNA